MFGGWFTGLGLCGFEFWTDIYVNVEVMIDFFACEVDVCVTVPVLRDFRVKFCGIRLLSRWNHARHKCDSE